jgi:hypothetical protein
MSTHDNNDLQQLNETVAQLAAAVSASERRYVALARVARWGVLGLVVFVSGVLYLASDWIADAYASRVQDRLMGAKGTTAQMPPDLDNLMMQLGKSEAVAGTMVKMLQYAGNVATLESSQRVCSEGPIMDATGKKALRDPRTGEAQKVCLATAAVNDLSEYFLDLPMPPTGPDGKPLQPPVKPNPQDPTYWQGGQFDKAKYEQDLARYEKELQGYMMQMQPYLKAVMESSLMAGGQAIVDMAVLIHRLRRDSDWLREKILDSGSVSAVVAGIASELDELNLAMRSVPFMAAEMNLMNRNMAAMSYSMGSTMGRMGNIMPW